MNFKRDISFGLRWFVERRQYWVIKREHLPVWEAWRRYLLAGSSWETPHSALLGPEQHIFLRCKEWSSPSPVQCELHQSKGTWREDGVSIYTSQWIQTHKQLSEKSYLSKARKAAASTSGSSISVDVVAMPPLNMASNTALPTARTNLQHIYHPYKTSHKVSLTSHQINQWNNSSPAW